MIAWIKHGKWGGPYRTERAEEVRERPLGHHVMGLSETPSGYGSRLRTRYQVKYRNRWRRLYCTCWSNLGTTWIVIDGQRVVCDLERQ